MLHKLHDGNYGIIFSRNNGVNFWKISSKGTFEDLKTAEGFFYPNPVKTTTTYMPQQIVRQSHEDHPYRRGGKFNAEKIV